MNGRHRAVQARRGLSWRRVRTHVVPLALMVLLVLLATFAQTVVAHRAVDTIITGR